MQSKRLSKTEEREEERRREKRKETKNTELKILAIKISFIQDFFNVLQTPQRETQIYPWREL